jgi:hypothetical protein
MIIKETCTNCGGTGKVNRQELPMLFTCHDEESIEQISLSRAQEEFGIDINYDKEGKLFGKWLYDNCPWPFVRGLHRILEEKHPVVNWD